MRACPASFPRLAPSRVLASALLPAVIALAALLPYHSTSAQVAPRVVSVSFLNAPFRGDAYHRGENIDVRVDFDRNVTVSSSSRLPLTIGANTRIARYFGGQDRIHGFRYTVQSDDMDSDGISIAADALNVSAGNIRDADDNTVEAILTHAAVVASAARKVDGSRSVPGLTLSRQSLVTPEGGTSTYSVVLISEPTAEVAIAVTRAPGGDADLTAHPGELTFTSTNWNVPQLVTISASDDDDALNGTATFSHAASSEDADYHGIQIPDVGATEADNELVYHIPRFPLAGNAQWQGFARIINLSRTPGEVHIEGVDDTGATYGPITLTMGASQTRHFNSLDLVDGNPSKGLLGGFGRDAEGTWRLRLVTDLQIEPLAYIRTHDGFVTTMHELAQSRRRGETTEYHVPFFNPASNRSQVSSLRLMNPTDDVVRVTITGIDDDGDAPPRGNVRLTLATGEVRTITSQTLEEGGDGLRGRFARGSDKWRLTVSAEGPIEVQNLLESRLTGHLANLSVPGLRGAASAESPITLPLFTSADNITQQGFARIINHSDASGTVNILGVDDAGEEFGPIRLSLGPRETRHFNSQDLESGNPTKGLPDGLGDGSGNWRLILQTTDLEIEPLAYVRTSEGFVTSVHEAVRASEAGYHIPIFNPAHNRDQRSWLRLINPHDTLVDVAISGQDDAANPPPQGQVSLTLGPRAAHAVTAADLESGAGALTGQFGRGTGKWQLFLTASAPIEVMSLLESPSGHLTNLSSRSAGTTDSLEAGVEVGEPIGHTAAVGEAAEITVRLTSRPFSTVTIPVRSSDDTEGVTETSQLIFTPQDWHLPQVVVVRGTNPRVLRDEQDYAISLGPTQSADPLYDGIEIPDVPMQGIVLEVEAPSPLHAFYPGLLGRLRASVRYTGQRPLSYALTSAPPGMSVDLSTGVLTWTPEDADAGKSHTITLSVTDGARFATATFQVPVAEPRVAETRVMNGSLTVTDGETNLNGLSISSRPALRSRAAASTSQSSTALTDLEVRIVEDESAPPLPVFVTPISDFFVIPEAHSAPVELRFPLRTLPAGADPRTVSLYAFGEVTDIPEPIWSAVFVDLDFELDQDELVIVLSAHGLQGLYVFGISNAPVGAQSLRGPVAGARPHLPSTSPLTTSAIVCKPRRWPLVLRPFGFPAIDHTRLTCTHSARPALDIEVKDFGSTAGTVKWGSATVLDLIQWLVDSLDKFDEYGLGYDQDIKVLVEPMQKMWGFVTTRLFEGRRTLHLNEDDRLAVHLMKGTAAHEYFHHAQGHADTITGNGTPLIDGNSTTNWMIEGSARWFEDELYDGDNTYIGAEKQGYRILESGLAAVPKQGIHATRAYQRFSFLKLLKQRCPGFDDSLRDLFTVGSGADPTGLRTLANALSGASCDFGDHLGAQKSGSLAAAIARYQHATIFEGALSFIDPNETAPFPLETTHQLLHAPDIQAFPLSRTFHVPPAGAQSMRVDAHAVEIPEGQVADISVSSSPGRVLVSLSSTHADFRGENVLIGRPHAWFDNREDDGYTFPEGARIPPLNLTVINPSLTNDVEVTVNIDVRDPDAEVSISSHSDGDTVNQRVVSVAGYVSPQIRTRVTRVVVTANGIDTEAALNSDGTFVADIVMALGDNLIEARAFRSGSALSGRSVVNVRGVQSATSQRNALLASRIAFVLRWDTALTDVDIYSTAQDGTLWYRNLSQGSGSLDYDDTSGFGPEVISYRSTDSDVYVNGAFDVDVHYYSGRVRTNYRLDVVLNETEGGLRRQHRFRSIVPLTESTGSRGDGSGGVETATSRFNDILTIRCDGARICSLAAYDQARLVGSARSLQAAASHTPTFEIRSFDSGKDAGMFPDLSPARTSHESCLQELAAAEAKAGGEVDWTCSVDGTKRWHPGAGGG